MHGWDCVPYVLLHSRWVLINSMAESLMEALTLIRCGEFEARYLSATNPNLAKIGIRRIVAAAGRGEFLAALRGWHRKIYSSSTWANRREDYYCLYV